jgi:hypothetical protein
MSTASVATAEHYSWGERCDRWCLVKSRDRVQTTRRDAPCRNGRPPQSRDGRSTCRTAFQASHAPTIASLRRMYFSDTAPRSRALASTRFRSIAAPMSRKRGLPLPSTMGQTTSRYSSISPSLTRDCASEMLPQTTMSLPDWPLSFATSSAALIVTILPSSHVPHGARSSVCEKQFSASRSTCRRTVFLHPPSHSANASQTFGRSLFRAESCRWCRGTRTGRRRNSDRPAWKRE